MNDRPGGAWEQFLFALLVAGGLQLVVATVLIVYDVLARNLGGSPFPHTVALTEYALLFLTFMGAPWLVRSNGHVRVQLFSGLLPARGRIFLARVAAGGCVLVCAVLGWYSAGVAIESYGRADVEMRSFDMPRWLIFAIMPISFALLAIEFTHKLLRAEAADAGPLTGHD